MILKSFTNKTEMKLNAPHKKNEKKYILKYFKVEASNVKYLYHEVLNSPG